MTEQPSRYGSHYLQDRRSAGLSDAAISAELMKAGWSTEHITELLDTPEVSSVLKHKNIPSRFGLWFEGVLSVLALGVLASWLFFRPALLGYFSKGTPTPTLAAETVDSQGNPVVLVQGKLALGDTTCKSPEIIAFSDPRIIATAASGVVRGQPVDANGNFNLYVPKKADILVLAKQDNALCLDAIAIPNDTHTLTIDASSTALTSVFPIGMVLPPSASDAQDFVKRVTTYPAYAEWLKGQLKVHSLSELTGDPTLSKDYLSHQEVVSSQIGELLTAAQNK